MAFSLTRTTPRPVDLAFGFAAGVVAVLLVHQVVVLLLYAAGMLPTRPYAITPVQPFGVPLIVNSMFWGGLWGVVWALIQPRLPRAWPLWAAGLVFGLAGPLLVNWFIVAPLKGQPVAAGLAPMLMLAGILILGFFGIGVALLYDWLRRWGGGRRWWGGRRW